MRAQRLDGVANGCCGKIPHECVDDFRSRLRDGDDEGLDAGRRVHLTTMKRERGSVKGILIKSLKNNSYFAVISHAPEHGGLKRSRGTLGRARRRWEFEISGSRQTNECKTLQKKGKKELSTCIIGNDTLIMVSRESCLRVSMLLFC